MKIAKRLGAAVCVLIAGTLPAPSAHAYEVNGCKYGGTNPTIRYQLVSMGAGWTTAFQVGQAAWDATSAPGFFTQVYDASRNLQAEDADYSFGAPAQQYGLCVGGIWRDNLSFIQFDTSYLAGYSSYQEEVVAIHEIGHAYGLAHETYTTCTIPSVMVYALAFICAPFDPPWVDDVAGVQHIY